MPRPFTADSRWLAAVIFTLASLVAPRAHAAAAAPSTRPDIRLRVDARDTPRGVLHVWQAFPARAGVLTLRYPRWIPGEHGPTGPSVDVAGFLPSADERRLAWTRDPADMTTLRITVPAGVSLVEVKFDFLLDNGTAGFSSAACSTPNLLLLSWNEVAFYPAGKQSDALNVTAALVLPDGWQHASALEEETRSGEAIAFKPCTLTRLVDSPVLAGRYFRTVDLAPGAANPIRLRMASDSPEGLAIPDREVHALQNLASEARTLFGGEHFRHYDFLVSLSDHIAHFGLEHHESSDDRANERWWLEDDLRRYHSNLLAHEYVHSWNGKFRRPVGLATGDYSTPMNGEMLWVYEGLTQYLGFVLAARSGIRTPEEAREQLALVAADLDANRGRAWRPLVDTGTHAQELYEARRAWRHWRRSTDFYDEGLLLWLEADVLIRTRTNGAKSLDDFCLAFHGGPFRGPELKSYTLADVIAALDKVAPYDWAAFFRERVYTPRAHPPLGGINAGGWKMAWTDSLGPMLTARETGDESVTETNSIGIELDKNGNIADVVPSSPADQAGLAPDMKLVAVNGRRYSKDVLRDAVAASRESGHIDLLCENKEFFQAHRLSYRDGRRYPVLERDTSKRDLVSDILTAHAGHD